MKAACPSYLVIGHVSEDIAPSGTRLGGSFTYSAITAYNLGERVGGITSTASNLQLPDVFRNIDVIRVPSPVTTTFENIYVNSKRKQFIRALASSIRPQDIPGAWLGADIVHLAPVAQEVSPEIARLFTQSFIGVTPQGWMRRWDANGKVYRKPWSGAEDILKLADAVVLSADDIYGGEKIIAQYAQFTKVLVVTRGADGADLHYQGQVHHFPAFPAVEIDPTGAGDVFAAAFFVKLHRGGDPFPAVRGGADRPRLITHRGIAVA